jgi:Sulfotransferase family
MSSRPQLVQPGPVFIGGPHRSGTGLLRAILGSNSALAIPPKEYHFFDLPAAWVTQAVCNPTRLLHEILSWPKIRQWGLTDAEVFALLPSIGAKIRDVYAAPLLAYASRLGKPGFGSKTPHLERHFAVLLEWFGSAMRFIQIIRDPLDTFCSMCHYNGFRRHTEVHEFALRWRTALLTGLHYRRAYPDNYMLLRYEDLVEQPVHWTQALCEFAGLPREIDRMLAMQDFEKKLNSSFPSAVQTPAALIRVVAPVMADRPVLDRRIARIIEREVFPAAREVGYLPR